MRGRTLLIAALGMAVPVAIGFAARRLEAGFTIGLGTMLLADRLAATVVAVNIGMDWAVRGPERPILR